MSLSQFTILNLFLALVWIQVYSSARHIYSGLSEYKTEIRKLHETLAARETEIKVHNEHFLEFRQNIATLMPEVLKEKGLGEEGYPYRSLASTLSKTDSVEIRKMLAKTIFEQGKEYYRREEYARANRMFRSVIENYGFSSFVVESYFLMSEGHFQSGEFEECTSLVQRMVELFPSHELTGFAMIRLGGIYRIQNRTEEAIEIYRTVLRSFPQRDVARQAKESLRGLEL